MAAEFPAPSPASYATFDSSDRERLRIAMVVPPYFDVPPKAYGGVEAVVAELVDALADRGHEVTLLGAGEPGTKAARFIPLWDEIQAARLGDPFPEVVHAMKVRRALERIAVVHGLDLVHDHTFAGPLNLPVYRDLGLPLVVTVHGPVDGDPYTYYREFGDEAELVAISDRQRELAPDLNWAGRVHNALRVEDWPFQPEKKDYALFLGRYTPDKAPHLALAAAHAVGLPLVLAGKCAEPPEKRYFDAEVAPLLTEQDTVFGMADTAAKRKLLSEARCLLFPVRWEEPFGMVMIEAMVCGTPVVALRGGAVSEVIVDGVTGRICDDPDEMPAAIKEVQTYDPQACRDHVIANFGTDTLGRGYEEVYQTVVRARRARRNTRVTTIHTWSGGTRQTPGVTPPVRAAGSGPGRAPMAGPSPRGSATPGTRTSGATTRVPGAAAGRAAGPAPSRVPTPATPGSIAPGTLTPGSIPSANPPRRPTIPTSRPLGTTCDSSAAPATPLELPTARTTSPIVAASDPHIVSAGGTTKPETSEAVTVGATDAIALGSDAVVPLSALGGRDAVILGMGEAVAGMEECVPDAGLGPISDAGVELISGTGVESGAPVVGGAASSSEPVGNESGIASAGHANDVVARDVPSRRCE